MKKLLIIGGNGFVGGRLTQKARMQNFEVALSDITESCAYPNIAYSQCDITDYTRVLLIINKHKPDFVVNVAAVSDIDFAQKNQQTAYNINVLGAANVARVTYDLQIKHMWFSSDAVFDGVREKYSESDTPDPVNYYGKTKYFGEQAVLKENPLAIVPRLSLILGLPVNKGNSFIAGLLEKLRNNQRVFCPLSEIRTPIDVYTLCDAILELYSVGYAGLIHLGSTESMNRYELTKIICQKSMFDINLIEAVSASDESRAPRHRNGIISIEKAKSILKSTEFCDIETTIINALKN